MRLALILAVTLAPLAACGSVKSDNPGDDAGGGDGDGDGDGDASPDAAPVVGVVFVTPASFAPVTSFSSVSDADQLCNDAAAEAGLGGSFVAWLSTSTEDAIDRLPDNHLWQRPDGAPVADSRADLTDGTLANPIALDAAGNDLGGVGVWTATDPDGTRHQDGVVDTCADWTDQTDQTMTGKSSVADDTWTANVAAGCGRVNGLYCFEI